MNKKRWLQGAIITSLVMLAATGCGQKKEPLGAASSAPTNTPAASSVPAATPGTEADQKSQETNTPEMKTVQIKVYYTDQNAEKLVENQENISYKTDREKYAAALNALKKSSDPNVIPLFEQVTFKSVTPDNDALKVDLSFTEAAQLGGSGEEMLIQALKKTAFQFPEISKLYITKDGKQVESLMGHFDLPYPITK